MKVFLMEGGDSFLGFLIRAHLHKAETPGPTGGAILHDVDGEYRTGLGKVILQVVLGRVVIKVSNE